MPRPAVVASLSSFGDRLAGTLARQLEGRFGGLPDSCRFLESSSNPSAQLGRALTEALDLRNAPDAQTLLDQRTPFGSPLVIALAAAAEVDDFSSIDQLLDVARREFRRSCLAGTLIPFVYAGSVNDRVPDDSVLAAFEDDRCGSIKVLYTDTDALGRRLREEDAIEAGSLFLSNLLASEPLQDRIAVIAREGAGLISFGIGRVDLSDAPVRRALRRRFRDQARTVVFPPGESPANGSLVLERIDLPSMMALHQQANGAFRPTQVALDQTADHSADRWLVAREREKAEITLDALRALIPPPPSPPPLRRTFWQRLWAWLVRVWQRLLRWVGLGRRPADPPHDRRPTPPTQAQSSTSIASDLVAAERLGVQVNRLASILEPESVEIARPTHPFEQVVGDLPEVQERALARCASTRDELDLALTQAFPAAFVLAEETDPDALRVRLEEVCERILKLNQRRGLLRLDDYRVVLDRVAEAVPPLFCGRGSSPKRLVLLPPHLSQAYEPCGHERIAGADNEVVFLAVQAGILPRSLFTSGINNNVKSINGQASAIR